MGEASLSTLKAEAADLIMDAGEAVFAESGFHAATTRAIAARAGVNAALIHYYFGNKERLFEDIVKRRAHEINVHRRDLLERLHRMDAQPALEAVIDAFLRPTIELGRDPSRGGEHYALLVVQVASGTDDRSRRLTAESYNDIARVFIDEIIAATPGLSRPNAVTGYLHAVAVGLSLMGETGRSIELLGAQRTDDDVESVIARAVTFIAAGIRALSEPL